MTRFKMYMLAAACGWSSMALAADSVPRPITGPDLFQFKWIGDPQLSRQGNELAYVGVKIDDARADYETSLFRVSTAGNDVRKLTAGKRDSSPRWSPDGKYLAFLRAVEKDGKPQPPQLFVLPMGGGEPQQLTRLPMGVSQPVWSPDGKTIAFLGTANEQDLARAACDERKDKGPASAQCAPAARATDVKVITRAIYRENNNGYVDFSRPHHIWTVSFSGAATPAAPVALTRGEFNESEVTWSPDSKRIYFASDRDHESYYELPKQVIYVMPAGGGAQAEVARFAGNLRALSISPQGKRLAFLGVLGAPVQSHTRPNLWLVDLPASGAPRNLTAKYDWEIGGAVTGDQTPPRAGGSSGLTWSPDGKAITVIVAKQGRANLETIDLHSGAVTPLTSGDQSVQGYSSNGTQIVAEISTTTELNDLYLVAPGSAPRRLTRVNDKLFAGLQLTAPKELWYSSFDGRKIHALVQTPPNFDPRKKYPLILNIHGGPHAAYGFTFFHEMQAMAAKGYVVLYPNPRGSTTYGEEFANVIQYRYPGDDYLDLMAGVDELVRQGSIDEAHMGVTGGSGGGLLTNWAIGHTDRFAAAVSQRDIADWSAWWYSADITFFRPSWFRKPPFEDASDYRERSPITYINKVRTPTMFVLGDADTRTPAESGGEQMFRALKYRKVPTVMVRFPGESHELSRSGKPWHRVERLQHIINWFDVYLQGKKVNDYAVMPPELPDLRATPAE